MRTSAAGSEPGGLSARVGGFTLLELLVVLALTALASAGVVLALAPPSQRALAEDAERLAARLDVARAQARLSGVPVTLRFHAGGFDEVGTRRQPAQTRWLHATTEVVTATPDTPAELTLVPEPVIGPRALALRDREQPGLLAVVATDGLRAFTVELRPSAP